VQLREVEGLEETIDILSGPDTEELLISLQESQQDFAAGRIFTEEEVRDYLELPRPKK